MRRKIPTQAVIYLSSIKLRYTFEKSDIGYTEKNGLSKRSSAFGFNTEIKT